MASGTGDQGRLSPTPVEATEVELPWGLEWDDLRGAVPDLHRPIGAFRTHEIRGLHQTGRSQILTIRYEGRAGPSQQRTIFLKINNPERPEIAKYRYLREHGAPVAPLLGTAATTAGEIMILQFLPTIGTTAGDVDDLLDLMAKLNSITEAPEDLFRPPPGNPGYGARIREALIDLLPSTDDASRWFDAYRQALVASHGIPLALNHNELSYQQVGWLESGHEGQSELVAFDLETMSLRPLYTDLAGMLPSLASQSGRSERDLFRAYLIMLDRRTGTTTDEHLGWNSLRTLRIVRTFESLPWLITMTDSAVVEAPDRAVERLARELDDSEFG